MPSLGWRISEHVAIADVRGERLLLVDMATPRWWVTNRAASLQPEELTSAPPFEEAPLSEQSLTFGTAETYFVIYKLTDRCNYRCTYCYDTLLPRRQDRTLRNTQIRLLLQHLLDERNARVQILFHGGEPLLELPEIREVVEAFESYPADRLSYAIQTNASLLKPEVAAFLASRRFGLSISVDGATADENRLRTNAARASAYEVAKQALAAIDTYAPSSVGLLVTVGEHNVSGLVDSLVRFEADGFRSVSLSFMHPVNAASRPADVGALTTFLRQATQRIAEGSLKDLAVWTLIQWGRRVLGQASDLVCLDSPCGAGRSVVTVLPSGEIGPCDSVFDDSYYRSDLPSYLAALAGGEFADLTLRTTATVEPCRSCDVRAFCNGTCPGNVILENGALTGVAAHECAIHYAWIREFMWLFSDPELGPPLLSYIGRHTRERVALRRQAIERV